MWRCQRVWGKVSGKGGRQGGWTCGSPGGGEAVLQLQHRDDLGTGWGAERAVLMRTDGAVWLELG